MICGCREVQKTVGVAESFQLLLSSRTVVQCSVSVRLINIYDFSQLFDCVSNIVPLTVKFTIYHHHKHQGLGHLTRSVSRVTADLASVSSVSQLFSFLVDCSGMILKGFGVVVFFASVRASSFCIHLFCVVCIQSVVRGLWNRWSYGH
jgi:hypothetical protein